VESSTIEIEYLNEDGFQKEVTLHLISSEDYDYHTVWETKEYPFIRITQEDYNVFKSYDDIIELTGDLPDYDKGIIAVKFNEFIDTFLNRPILIDVLIKREEDDVAFEYGEIYYKVFRHSNNEFIETYSNIALMNNINGYVRIEHLVKNEVNDRFFKIEKVKIGLKTPSYPNERQEYYEDSIYYANDNNGFVRGISNKNNCPRIEIRASFMKSPFENIDFAGHIFIGTTI
jgi:hypothetical protein